MWYGGALAICSAEEFKQSKLVCVSALNALHGNADCDNHLRATPPVLSLWPYKRKLNEEKSKHDGLAQQNGFDPAFSHKMKRPVKATAKPTTCC